MEIFEENTTYYLDKVAIGIMDIQQSKKMLCSFLKHNRKIIVQGLVGGFEAEANLRDVI